MEKDTQPVKEDASLTVFKILVEFLKSQKITPSTYLYLSSGQLTKCLKGDRIPLIAKRKLAISFKGFNYWKVSKGKAKLPDNPDDYLFQQKTSKLRALDHYLSCKENLTLARAISLSDTHYKNLISGRTLPSKGLLKKIATYFLLPPSYLLDDATPLPSEDDLKIDEDLAAIQRNDLAEEMNKVKNKHFFARNYRVLSHSKRISMWLSLLVMVIPLAAYTGYCTYAVLESRANSISQFEKTDIRNDSDIEFEAAHFADNATDPITSDVVVNVGIQVTKLSGLQAANESFVASMKIWFDFNQGEFHSMFAHYKTGDPSGYDEAGLTDEQKLTDVISVNSSTDLVTYGADGIPDYIELATPSKLWSIVDESKDESNNNEIIARSSDASLNPLWTTERISYPGLTPSNVYSSYSPNWSVESGTLDTSTLLYSSAPGEPYYLANDENSDPVEYRFFQCLSVNATIHKAYDNPRYPLETAQFWGNIATTDWLSVKYLRYNLAETVDVSREQVSGISSYGYCSIDEGTYTTNGSNPSLTDGFRLIKTDSGYKWHVEGIEYNINSSVPSESHSKLTFVIRANRDAFTSDSLLPATFLSSYINLFAVIIWIIIAFYNQSFSGDDSLGMLGTGMFSAISATIAGINLLSNSSMFSLLTMIDIFTLAVVLIMTYHSVASKRAKSKNDKAEIAYSGVKMRVIFYVLTICTLIIFIGLPIASYIWMV